MVPSVLKYSQLVGCSQEIIGGMLGEGSPRWNRRLASRLYPCTLFRILLKSSSQVVPSAGDKAGNFAQQAAVGPRLRLSGSPGLEAITTEKLYIHSHAKVQPATTLGWEKMTTEGNTKGHQKDIIILILCSYSLKTDRKEDEAIPTMQISTLSSGEFANHLSGQSHMWSHPLEIFLCCQDMAWVTFGMLEC